MILLDTHAWVWWVSRQPGLLPASLVNRLATTTEPVCIASVSCLEVALLVKKRRLELSGALDDWFALAIDASGIELLPLTPAIAARTVSLPDLHKDPIDRVLIATALEHDAVLITKDRSVSCYPDVRTEWA